MPVNLEREGQIGIVTISRPEAFNAFNSEQLQNMLAVTEKIHQDKSLRVIIVTGEGKRAFVSGADIKEMSTLRPAEGYTFARLGQSVTSAIEGTPQPWIAAINGFALGGGFEIALACDIRLAGDNALLGAPEVGLGILPGWGCTQRLPALVGRGIASELILTGRRVGADEALQLGLVNAVHPLDELLPNAKALAESIAANAPLAVQASKRAILRSHDLGMNDGLEFEAQTFGMLFDSADQKAGMQGFLEKQKVEYTGA